MLYSRLKAYGYFARVRRSRNTTAGGRELVFPTFSMKARIPQCDRMRMSDQLGGKSKCAENEAQVGFLMLPSVNMANEMCSNAKWPIQL